MIYFIQETISLSSTNSKCCVKSPQAFCSLSSASNRFLFFTRQEQKIIFKKNSSLFLSLALIQLLFFYSREIATGRRRLNELKVSPFLVEFSCFLYKKKNILFFCVYKKALSHFLPFFFSLYSTTHSHRRRRCRSGRRQLAKGGEKVSRNKKFSSLSSSREYKQKSSSSGE